MSNAKIVIQQGTSKGPAGISRDDIVTGEPVLLTNNNNDGVRSWRWSIRLPKGSTSVLTNSVGAQPQFVPDVEGTYVVRLTVDQGDEGQVDTVLVTVRNDAIPTIYGPIATRYLGIREDDEANWTVDLGAGPVTNTTGWWDDLDRWFRVLYSMASGGGLPTVDPWSVVLSNGNTTGPVSPVVDSASSVVYVYAGTSPETATHGLNTSDGATTAAYDVPVYFQAAGTVGGGALLPISDFVSPDPGGAEAVADVTIQVGGRSVVGGVSTNISYRFEGKLQTDGSVPLLSVYLLAGNVALFRITNSPGALTLSYVDSTPTDTLDLHGKITVALAAK